VNKKCLEHFYIYVVDIIIVIAAVIAAGGNIVFSFTKLRSTPFSVLNLFFCALEMEVSTRISMEMKIPWKCNRNWSKIKSLEFECELETS